MKKILIATLCSLIMIVTNLQAAFDQSPSKRINGIGGAGVAVQGDPLGFYYNPAAPAWGTFSAFETQYEKHFWGLEGDQLAQTALGGYLTLSNWGNIAVGFDVMNSALYSEKRSVIGYSKKLQTPYGAGAVGIGLNLLERGYKENQYTSIDPFFQENGFRKNSASLDLGLQWSPDSQTTLGLAILRLNRPNQSLADANDPLPRQISFGGSYLWKKYHLFGELQYRDVPLNGSDFSPKLGVETSLLKDVLVLRAGGNRDEISLGFGINIYSKSTTAQFTVPGAGGKTRKIEEQKSLITHFGYVFRYPIGGVAGTAGHHLFGVDIFFDRVQNLVSTKVVEKVRDRIVVQKDTVRVTEVKYVQIEKEDSAKIKIMQSELDSLNAQLRLLRSLNIALGHLENALELYYQKKYQKAIGECEIAQELIPHAALPYVRKGSIYYAMGRWDDARREWQKALEIDSDNAEVKKFLKALPR